jgi:hypothetical protein
MNGSNYIGVGYNFLKLSINSIDEMIKQGNKRLIISSADQSNDDEWKEYDEQTKWNDQNIGIPILFNFFHGTELILKGLILQCGGIIEQKTRHKLSDLLKNLKNCPNPPNDKLVNHLQKIINGIGLEDFFEINSSSVDSFYELFKYPKLNNGKDVEFWMIRGTEEIGLERFKYISDLASSIKLEIIEWKNLA